MREPLDQTRFITFYSYKGGVGRTMAVANVACRLANKHGLHVICVDWDLEAPGLHYYFGLRDANLRRKRGLLDYLEDFKEQVEKGAQGRLPRIKTYLKELPEAISGKLRFGSVRLMHCGRTNRKYTARVQAFDWNAFYEDCEGYRGIELLKQQLIEDAHADVVLIDARAGQAEVGATPSIQVPDAVVLMFTSNAQSIEGTEQIVKELAQHPLRDRPPKIVLSPARVFPKEETFQRWLEDEARLVYERLLERGLLSLHDQPRGLGQCIIPVDPKFAVGESLPALEERVNDRLTPEIVDAYADLARALSNLLAGRAAWTTSPAAPVAADEASQHIKTLRKEIDQAADRGDHEALAVKQFLLGRAARHSGDLALAEAMLQTSRTYNRQAGDDRAVGVITHEMALVKQEQGDGQAAWEMFQQALELKREADDKREQALTLHEMAVMKRDEGDSEAAWRMFQQALELKREVDDKRGQAVTLHAMGRLALTEGDAAKATELFDAGLSAAEAAGDDAGAEFHREALAECRRELKRDSPGK